MHQDFCIPLTVDRKSYKIYLSHIPTPQPHSIMALHKHAVSEVHLVIMGRIAFKLEGRNYEVAAGQAFLIPPNTYHSSTAMLHNSKEYAFFVNAEMPACRTVQYPRVIFSEILHSLKECQRLNSVSPMIPCFFRLVSDLVLNGRFEKLEKIDPMYTIREYFNANYNQNPSLQELAQLLKLSTKQVQRIIMNETGHTFTQEVVAKRMRTAEYLLKQGEYTYAEVAKAVGYQTYTGFWKARQQFYKNQEVTPPPINEEL